VSAREREKKQEKGGRERSMGLTWRSNTFDVPKLNSMERSEDVSTRCSSLNNDGDTQDGWRLMVHRNNGVGCCV